MSIYRAASLRPLSQRFAYVEWAMRAEIYPLQMLQRVGQSAPSWKLPARAPLAGLNVTIVPDRIEAIALVFVARFHSNAAILSEPQCGRSDNLTHRT